MLDVKRRFGDVRAYVAALEDWMIDDAGDLRRAGRALAGPRRRMGAPGRTATAAGAEPRQDRRHRRAAVALGELARHRLNVAPDLGHYAGIVPCGIRDAGVTSLAALGRNVSLDEVDRALRTAFERRFGATRSAMPEGRHNLASTSAKWLSPFARGV